MKVHAKNENANHDIRNLHRFHIFIQRASKSDNGQRMYKDVYSRFSGWRYQDGNLEQ